MVLGGQVLVVGSSRCIGCGGCAVSCERDFFGLAGMLSFTFLLKVLLGAFHLETKSHLKVTKYFTILIFENNLDTKNEIPFFA